MSSNIGGIYTDPFHSPTTASANIFGYDAPWFGGIRICGSKKDSPQDFVCIGSDDGIYFWTLKGKYTDINAGLIDMDFTPKAPGVGNLKCSYVPGALSFLENDGSVGNTWSRLTPNSEFDLVTQTKHDAFNNVNGLYVDPSIYKPGSFAGIRVVSDRLGKIVRDEICVLGTDDGEEWWTMEGGTFTDKAAGKFNISSLLTGTCHNGTIEFDDGKQWTKMAVKSDFHALDRETTKCTPN